MAERDLINCTPLDLAHEMEQEINYIFRDYRKLLVVRFYRAPKANVVSNRVAREKLQLIPDIAQGQIYEAIGDKILDKAHKNGLIHREKLTNKYLEVVACKIKLHYRISLTGACKLEALFGAIMEDSNGNWKIVCRVINHLLNTPLASL